MATIPGVETDPSIVETNIMRFTLDRKIMRRLKVDYRGFSGLLREGYGISCNAGFSNDNLRFVTHRDVSRADCEKAIKAVKALVQ